MPFVKLDCGIIHSSLWAEDSDTKICWITLLLLADATGFVRAAASAIAREAGIPAEVARRALDLFQGPDDESRTPDNQGKRIERVDGGYRVLNYEKYRERDYTAAIRQKRFREKHKNNGVTSVTKRVTSRRVTHADAEAEADEIKIYRAYPMKVGKPDALRAIKKAISRGYSASHLLERVQAFAAARNGDLNFCPNPATWFNQERFNDDPETWKPKSNGQIKPKEKAPSYQKITPPRELTPEEEAESERARRIAHEETARFKEQMSNG